MTEPATPSNPYESSDSLVKEGDGPEGNFPMRSKFEKMCREAQKSITAAIEELDGEGTFQEDAWIRPSTLCALTATSR